MKIDSELLKLNSNILSRKVRSSPELTSLFMTTFYWAEDIRESVFCGKEGIVDLPKCEYPGCNKKKKFLTSCGHHQYAKGCCTSHSSKSISLEKNGVEIPQQLESVKNKTRETNLARYGSTSPAGSLRVRDKMQNTMEERYGVKFAAHSPMILADLRLKKFKEHTDRFSSSVVPLFNAEDYTNQHKEYRWECVKCKTSFWDMIRTSSRDIPLCPTCNPHNTSRAEREISDFLTPLDLEVVINSRRIISPLELDIYIPEKKTAIEFNGLYWHKNKYHLEKTIECDSKGIQLIQIFEDEWVSKKDICKSILLSKLGCLRDRIFARHCEIVEVRSNDAALFFDKNHIQGRVLSRVNYGLLFDNQLVCCMSFGKSRYDKKIEWELLRYACKLNTAVIGGAGKLWNHFVKCIDPPSVISYADRRYSKGNLYSVLGFSYSHASTPSYSYYKDGNPKRLSRIQFQKHKLKDILPSFNASKTEWENMRDNGYHRIWDCGNLVYTWIGLSSGQS